jgi:type VI secretion system secreted protein VgrG
MRSQKAAAFTLSGPASLQPRLPLLPKSDGKPGDQYFILQSYDGKPIQNRRYRAYTANKFIEGLTDEEGHTQILEGFIGEVARFELVDESYDEHFILRDPLGMPLANMRYRLKSEAGIEIEGITDEYGRTALLTSDKVEKVELFFVPENHPEDEGVG